MNILLILLLFCFSFDNIYAADNLPTVTRLEGDVSLLTSPSRKISGSPPHVRYQGYFYSIIPVELGTVIKARDVLQTKATGKAKLIYPNGDVIMVAPGSNFRHFIKNKVSDKETSIFELLLGKVRMVFSKDGPRNGSEIKASSTVMGVRGTDFYINTRDKSGRLNLAVLRGVVSLQGGEDGKTSGEVKTGEFARVSDEPSSEKGVKIDIRKLSQGDLLAIHQVTKVDNRYGYGQSMMALTAKPKSKLERKLEKLEKQAAKSMEKDVEHYDRNLLEKLKKSKKVKTIDDIDKLYEEAR